MIALLHTLSSNVTKFEALSKAYAPHKEVMHFVNEDILTNALKNGKTDYAGFEAEVEKIKAHKPEIVICTCSSYGEACDRRADIERIDGPIVEHMINKYGRIGLAYAAISTRDISANLILDTGKRLKKEVEIIDIDCSAAWHHHVGNAPEKYARVIADTIEENSDGVEVVFLAQASMEGAINLLHGFEKEVLSSPEFGIKHYLGASSD